MNRIKILCFLCLLGFAFYIIKIVFITPKEPIDPFCFMEAVGFGIFGTILIYKSKKKVKN